MARERAARGAALSAGLAALLGASCAYRAPRFVDRPAVTEIADDAPAPTPKATTFVEALYVSEVLVRRALALSLDPARIPAAKDVNALDEVPRSSWYEPSPGPQGDTSDGPPAPPLKVLADRPDTPASLAVIDSRGLRYELRFDPPLHAEMRSGAAAAASVLLRAMGYLTAESYALEIARADLVAAPGSSFADVLAAAKVPASGPLRVGAVRWPIGIDLGPTPPSAPRSDDPNDRIQHEERRTLRALAAAGAWLGISRWDAHALRDAYVGPPGRGHVRHYLAGLDGALGADTLSSLTEEGEEANDPRPLVRLLTLGLLPRRWVKAPETAFPSLGVIDEQVDGPDFSPRLPFEPIDQALPEDLYWAAKRIAAIPAERLDAAVEAARLSDPAARKALRRILERRQAQVVAAGFALVTPCEGVRLDGWTLRMHDEARRLGVEPPGTTRYEIAIVDRSGTALAPTLTLSSDQAESAVPLPAAVLGAAGYVVLQITAVRGGWRAPQPLDVHVTTRGGAAPRILGLRHGR